jgi:hypothetical protein
MAATKQSQRRRTSRASRAAATEPENDRDTRWWVIVASSNPDVGSGRYGFWAAKPTISEDNGVVKVSGEDSEPTMFVNLEDTLTVTAGQVEHFDAVPRGKQTEQQVTDGQQG